MPIPYRVWVTDLKYYLIGNELVGHQTLVPAGTLGATHTEDSWLSILVLALMGGPKFVAEQWTGLTDNAGIRIYAGDIVDGTDSNGWECEPDRYRIIIEWSAERLMWLAKDPWSGETFELGDYGCLDRVVGNVREHPDLARGDESVIEEPLP